MTQKRFGHVAELADADSPCFGTPIEHERDFQTLSCVLVLMTEDTAFVCFCHSAEDRRLNFFKGGLNPGSRERLCI